MNSSFKNFLAIFAIFIQNAICISDLNEILSELYNKMKLISHGSTIYFSRNGKCTNDDSTPLFCLVDNKLYKVSEENKELILDIPNYNPEFYYELNIFGKKDYKNVTCIITYINDNNEIKFLFYKINNLIEYNLNKEHSLNISRANPINKYINCQKEFDSKLVCFYRNKDGFIQKIEFNFHNDYSSNFVNDFKVKYNDDSISDDDFIIFSYLNNKIKYILCLNSSKYDDFQIYTKKNFPNTNLNTNGHTINNLDKIEFSCKYNTGKLLSFLFIKNDDLSSYRQENKGNFIFFSERISNMSLTRINNISSVLKSKDANTIQLYIVKAMNLTNEIYYDGKNFSSTNKIEKSISLSDFTLISEKDKTIIPDRSILSYISILPSTTTYMFPRNNKIIQKLSLSKPNITKENILENIQNIIEDTIIGETYEYQKDDYCILIYPTDSNLTTNKTHIDFFECESILKTHYNLSNQSIITLFQLEISNKNEHSLINQVEYQVYDEQKNILDLAKCNDSNINIFYGIKKDSNLDISVVNSFKDSGVNVFNITDEFFNDVCYPYSENGNDVILEDRIKDIYQNFTLCEEGCSFNDIDIFNMLISCQCNIKQNITTIIKEIKEEAAEKISSLNFEIIRCYNLVFSFKGKMGNIGFWILSIFFVIYILFFIIYICNGIKPMQDYIFNEMTKFGYIENSEKSKIKPNKMNKKQLKTKNLKIEKTEINYPPKKIKSKKKNLSILNKPEKANKSSSIINQINLSNKIIITNNNEKKDNTKNVKDLDLNLISINLNNLSKVDNIPKESNITLYNYTMKEAFKYDRRNIIVIFYIYFLSKQAFFHAHL